MGSVLVTGGNRGIGLELARQLADRGDRVIVTCRQSSRALEALPVRTITGIDVTGQACLEKVATALEGTTLNMLIHNAGILTRETWNDLDFDRIRRQFEVNTLGPLRLVSALRNNLSAGSRVGIISSRMGSIGDNDSGGMYGYRISKAAANMVGKTLSRDLAEQGIAVLLLHPGMVATEMTGGRGIDVEDSARGLIQRMDELNLEGSGGFQHAEGYPLPW